VRTLAEVAAGFGQALRSRGVEVPLSAISCFAEALCVIDVADPGAVFWAGRACLVNRPEDLSAYSESFAQFFGARPWERNEAASSQGQAESEAPESAPDGATVRELLIDVDAGGEAADDPGDPEPSTVAQALLYSPVEVLRRKDFATCSAEELAELYRLMGLMRRRAARRRTRRRVPDARSRGALDLRRTVRSSLRTAGEPARLRRFGRAERDRALVLLVDVSGSMEPYARALLHFVHAAVVGRQRVEAFALGTQLTRITRQLSWRDPDTAVARAIAMVPDLAGGTRLGDGLRTFNDRFGVAGFARGAVVVILSDGWDRGDPEKVDQEMARLRRVAYRVIWVNPIKATPGYAPLARGMAAALPHVDEFLDGHSLEALDTLVEVMAK